MRNPIRSEADAFRFVLLTIGYFALIVIGSMINVWVGVAVFVVLTAGVLLWNVAYATGTAVHMVRLYVSVPPCQPQPQ